MLCKQSSHSSHQQKTRSGDKGHEKESDDRVISEMVSDINNKLSNTVKPPPSKELANNEKSFADDGLDNGNFKTILKIGEDNKQNITTNALMDNNYQNLMQQNKSNLIRALNEKLSQKH